MRQTITQKDIDRYSSMINQNKVQGAVAVYEELRQKGYGYAGCGRTAWQRENL